MTQCVSIPLCEETVEKDENDTGVLLEGMKNK